MPLLSVSCSVRFGGWWFWGSVLTRWCALGICFFFPLEVLSTSESPGKVTITELFSYHQQSVWRDRE